MLNKGLEALAALATASSGGRSSSAATAGGNQTQINNSLAAGSVQQQQAADQNEGRGDARILAPVTVPQNPNQQTSWQQQSLAAGINQAALSSPNMALFQGLQQLPQAANSSALLAVQQQMNYLNYLVNAQSASTHNAANAGPAPSLPSSAPLAGLDANQALQFALSGQTAARLLQNQDDKSRSTPQVLPAGSSGVAETPSAASMASKVTSNVLTAGASTAAMPPPQSSASQSGWNSISSMASSQEPTAIAPQPTFGGMSATASYDDGMYEAQVHDKKQQKRAANRRSAQLSRKRKKQFIEELKEENDDLRRKEQILRSIPDLIVVFDSSGRLWFVSESVDRFLDFTAEELEGTSFWDRLCEDSIRLLKAAFMDSLAARQPESDTAPLGAGVWELRLVDKNDSQKVVTLNGVVHFAGERPECVCSIRPRDETKTLGPTTEEQMKEESALSIDETKYSSELGPNMKSLLKVKPQQSVVSNGSLSVSLKPRSKKQRLGGKRGEAVRISDSGNSSVESESGSSDEMTGVVA